MRTHSYGQLEKALRRAGFLRTRAGAHNLWEQIGPDGTARRVIVCGKSLRRMPPPVQERLLRHAGLAGSDLR